MTTHSPSPKTRIVACRGSVQLASAIAAMWTHSGRSACDAGMENHLVAYDLSAPKGQNEEFADCIELLARSVERWETFHFIPREQIIRLQKEAAQGFGSPQQQLEHLLGIPSCDELFIGPDKKFVNRYLRDATPTAKHVSFGDGLGLNFSQAYFTPEPGHDPDADKPFFKRMRRRLRRRWKRFRGKEEPAESSHPRGFDLHCLLLENLFDQQLTNIQSIDAELFLELFDAFGRDFPERVPAMHAELSDLSSKPGQTSVLLTSNYSETGRMSLEGEVRGYLELLKKMPQGDHVTLVIKPHPRDSYDKIAAIREATESLYERMISLSDDWSFYVPFESLYARYLMPNTSVGRTTHVATVSSACIGLEHLYGQRCTLGFGSRCVSREFAPAWRARRHMHEKDLRRIVVSLRKKRAQHVTGRRSAA